MVCPAVNGGLNSKKARKLAFLLFLNKGGPMSDKKDDSGLNHEDPLAQKRHVIVNELANGCYTYFLIKMQLTTIYANWTSGLKNTQRTLPSSLMKSLSNL